MRTGSAALALVAALVLTGCAPQGDEDPLPTPTVTRTVLTKAAVPLPTLPHRVVAWPAPPVYTDQSTILVGSEAIDVSPLHADSAVSTRGGVYFLSAGELWYLGEHGATATGFTHLTGVVASGDGRYLGLVDRNHGPVGTDQVQVATAVVYDASSGGAVVHSRAGMRGDPGTDGSDLAADYEDDPPEAIGFEDGALVASTPAGTYAYPLTGADPHRRS